MSQKGSGVWVRPLDTTTIPDGIGTMTTVTLTYDPWVNGIGVYSPSKFYVVDSYARFDLLPKSEKQFWLISIFRKVKVKPVKGKPSWPPYMSVPAGTKSGVVAPTAKEAINRFICENPEYGGKKYEVKAVPDIQQPNFNR